MSSVDRDAQNANHAASILIWLGSVIVAIQHVSRFFAESIHREVRLTGIFLQGDQLLSVYATCLAFHAVLLIRVECRNGTMQCKHSFFNCPELLGLIQLVSQLLALIMHSCCYLALLCVRRLAVTS